MDAVERHYSRGKILDQVLAGLKAMGKDLDHLTLRDLGAVDEFHIRGGEATRELSLKVTIPAGCQVLDIGSGLGGSARYLASTFGCSVEGVDLTHEFAEVATALTERLHLSDHVRFRQGSATDLPFKNASFDLAWTEHVQMNIRDKERFYAEGCRVLRPGGHFVFHDVFGIDSKGLEYPLPWASEPSISFLASASAIRSQLGVLGLREIVWDDCTERSYQWVQSTLSKPMPDPMPPVSLHILIGPDIREKLANFGRGVELGKLQVIQGVFQRI